MRHMPEGTLSLAPRPGSLVRLAFQKWSLELLAKSQREESLGNLLPPGFARGLGLAAFLEKESFRKNEHPTKALGQETVVAPVHDVSAFHVSFLLNGPRGRTCTCWPSVRTLPGLSGAPFKCRVKSVEFRMILAVVCAFFTFHSALFIQWCPRSDLHRHCARFKCAVSALDYVGCWRRANKLVPREGFGFPSPPQDGCPRLGCSLSRIVVHP